LLPVLILSLPGMKTVAADKPASISTHVFASDTLKKLGILVENNKVSNNPLSIKYAKMALAMALKSDSITDLVDAYKWLGKAYMQNQMDSSYYYYNLALHIADSNHLIKQKAHICYNLASLRSAAYDYKNAISLLDLSNRLAESVKDPEGIANAYIAIGNIHFNTHDYKNARIMFDSALKFSSRNTLYKQMGVATANLARRPFEVDSKKSLTELKKALFYLSKVNGVEEEMAYIYINIGTLNVNPDSALFYYKTALNLAIKTNLPKIRFGAYNNMAYSYLDKGDVKSAESCLLGNAIPDAQKLNDNNWLSSLYDTYADVCAQKGEYKKALDFQKKAMRSRDADYKQKASEEVSLLAALLEVTKKEMIIQDEQKELLLQKTKLQQTQLWLVVALLFIAATLFITYVMQQRNKAKLQKEQISSAKRIIEMEETEKGRTSRELHDLTGQLVLGISGTIENIEFPDPEIKEQLNKRIKELGVSIRQISHRMNRAMIEHFTFSEMISGLCEDVQKLSHLHIELDMPDEFPDLPNEQVLHFYRITQELLTNAGKYARESKVKIRILAGNGRITLLYSDNGPGFTLGEQVKPSMGVLNIFERAKLEGGQAILTTAPGKGTSWEIYFPLGQKINIS